MASTQSNTLESIDTKAAVSVDAEQALSPSHVEERERLEKLLRNRSDKKDLQDKNILKADNVAPALQAASSELQRHQIEDKLEGRLERRPEREDLERRGILKDQSVAPALQGKLSELEKSQLGDKLGKEFAARPDANDLRVKGILKDDE